MPTVVARVQVVVRGHAEHVHGQRVVGSEVVSTANVPEVRPVEPPGDPVRVEPPRVVRGDVLVLVEEHVIRWIGVARDTENDVGARIERPDKLPPGRGRGLPDAFQHMQRRACRPWRLSSSSALEQETADDQDEQQHQEGVGLALPSRASSRHDSSSLLDPGARP